MSDTQQFSFTLEQQEDFAFLIRFDKDLPPLLADEPPPLGKDAGPNPSRLLAASVANCLSAKWPGFPQLVGQSVARLHGGGISDA